MLQALTDVASRLKPCCNILCPAGTMKRAAQSAPEWCVKSRRTAATSATVRENETILRVGGVAAPVAVASVASVASVSVVSVPAAPARARKKRTLDQLKAAAARAEAAEAQLRQEAAKAGVAAAAAEAQLRQVRREVERERMQLAARIAGVARQKFLGAPTITNSFGLSCYEDPDPDIDRLHVKVWPEGGSSSNDPTRYICFLDANYSDTIATLKAKIQDHPEGMPADQMIVIFRGKKLEDTATLADHNIFDDCILYCVTKQHVAVLQLVCP